MTKDNGMDVSPSWQELKEERDSWRSVSERLEEEKQILKSQVDRLFFAKAQSERSELAAAQELDEVKAERDALAAKVIEKCEQLKYRDSAQRRYNLALGDIQAYVETLSPATSLARLKSEWQSEVLHKLLMHPREATLRQRACELRDQLRHQSKEPQP